MTKIIGLTGGIATGKSTVTRMLRDGGCEVIDCDELARKVMEPGQRAYRAVVKKFGNEILLADGTVDRPKLGSIVFNSPEKRRTLNNCTRLPILALIFRELLDSWLFSRPRILIVDAPLLYETGILPFFMDKVIVVFSSRDVQLKRLMQRNNYTQEEAESRMRAQLSTEVKKKRADYVIYNDGTREETQEQVSALVSEIKRRSFLGIKTITFPFLLIFSTLLVHLMMLFQSC